MDDDWQNLEGPKPIPKIVDQNKWEGEDEDDDIKDSWDAEDDDEKKDEEKVAPVAKPKKTLQQKIREREQKKMLELEEKRNLEKDFSNLSAEEQRRLKQLQEDADLKTALDTLGIGSSSNLDSFNPNTKEEFAEFSDVLIKTITQFKTKDEYIPFLDDFIRNLLASLPSTSIRKVKATIDNLHLEKQKMEKGDKPKKKGGAKVKARLRVEGEDDYSSRAGAFDDDDYDDFM